MRRGVLLTFGLLLKNPSQITNSGVFATCLLKACHYNVSFIHTNIKLIITCNTNKYKSFDFLRFETSGFDFNEGLPPDKKKRKSLVFQDHVEEAGLFFLLDFPRMLRIP